MIEKNAETSNSDDFWRDLNARARGLAVGENAKEANQEACLEGEPPEELRGDAWEDPRDRLHVGRVNGEPITPDTVPTLDQPSECQQPPDDALPIMTCSELLHTYPERRPAVIEGLLRQGETMNVIAPAKIGKSWLTLGLAFAVATGRTWLGSFKTTPGKVLIIDNELHPETSAHRLRTLAKADNVSFDEIAERVHIVNLRGRLADLYKLGTEMVKIERGRYLLIIIDAFYRALPLNCDENSNANVAGLYNQLDRIADSLGAAFVLIHHSTKGSQSAKSVTDVGAGAGAQSRAADSHLVLRTHEETNVVVLDAAVRSWPPVTPACLRWDFPLWTPAPDLDPSALRVDRQRRRKPEGQEPGKPKEPPWTARRFADAFGKPEPRARGAVLEEARLLGLSDRKAADLLKAAVECGYLFSWRADGQANRLLVATVKPELPPAPTVEETPPEKPRRKHKKRHTHTHAHPPHTPPDCVNAAGGGVL